jgi:hypothetical protein
MFTSLAKEANFGYAGSAGCRCRQLPRAWLLGLDGFGAASRRQAGHDCSSIARATVVPCTTGHPALVPPRGSYKTSYAAEVAVTSLDGLVLTPVWGWGRGPFCTR